jgi:hypothetical protein
MRMSQGTAGLMIAAACFLPGNASAFGRTLALDRDGVLVSTASSHKASNRVLLPFSGRGSNAAANQSIEAGLPCPTGHPWQGADSTQDSARPNSERPNPTARVSGKTASTSKTSKSGNDKTIIFVGGKKAQVNNKAPTASANARTGELRHNQSNIRREEKK